MTPEEPATNTATGTGTSISISTEQAQAPPPPLADPMNSTTTNDPARLTEELTTLQVAYQTLQVQNEALQNEVQSLKTKLEEVQAQAQAQAQAVVQQQQQEQQQQMVDNNNSNMNVNASSSSVATAAAAAQLDNYQQALSLSESQKEQVMAENEVLKNKLAQFGVTCTFEQHGVAVGAGAEMTAEGTAAAAAATSGEMVVDSTNDPTLTAGGAGTGAENITVNIMGTAAAAAAAAATDQHHNPHGGAGLGVALGNGGVGGGAGGGGEEEEDRDETTDVNLPLLQVQEQAQHQHQHQQHQHQHQHHHHHHHTGQLDISAAEAEALAAVGSTVHHNGHQEHQEHQHQHQHQHQHTQQLTHDPTMATATMLASPTAVTPTGLSSRSDEKWEQHFQRLVDYKTTNGNCLVPTSTELGRWLCRQRHNHRYKGLKEDRKMRLVELDPTCLGERLGALNNSMYHQHQQEEQQQQQQPEQQQQDQEQHQLSQLNSVANVNVNDPNSNCNSILQQNSPPLQSKTKYNLAYESKLHAKWDHYFQQLLSYKNKHGHSNFPTMNGSLGRWISRQRTLYRSQKLKSDRFEKLKSIGFAFEDATALEFRGKLDLQWDNMYTQLNQHRERTGHCFDVPENMPLGKWLYRQRWLYRHGNLREDRAKRLLEIGFEDKKVLKKDTEKKRKRKRPSTESNEGDVVDPVSDTVDVDQQQGGQGQSLAAPQLESTGEQKRETEDSIAFDQMVEESMRNENAKNQIVEESIGNEEAVKESGENNAISV